MRKFAMSERYSEHHESFSHEGEETLVVVRTEHSG